MRTDPVGTGATSTSEPIGRIGSAGPPITTYDESPTRRTAIRPRDRATIVVVTVTATTVANACATPRTGRSAIRPDIACLPCLATAARWRPLHSPADAPATP